GGETDQDRQHQWVDVRQAHRAQRLRQRGGSERGDEEDVEAKFLPHRSPSNSGLCSQLTVSHITPSQLTLSHVMLSQLTPSHVTASHVTPSHVTPSQF